jgi:hypothetical protein
MPSSSIETISLSGLEEEVDQIVALCDGDARAAVKALMVANAGLRMELAGLDAEMAQLLADVSRGYARGHWNWLLERAEMPIPYTP